MKLIKPIVDYINSTLQTGKLNGYHWQSAKWFGVCDVSAGVDEDGKVEYFIHYNGQDVTPDDTYPATVYHRCLGVQFPAAGSSYGDGNQTVRVRYNMRSIVFADPEKIKMEPCDLAFLFCAGFPSEVKRTVLNLNGVYKCTITATGAEVETEKVFKGEFGVAYTANLSESVLIAVNYGIEIEADRTCLSCQDCN